MVIIKEIKNPLNTILNIKMLYKSKTGFSVECTAAYKIMFRAPINLLKLQIDLKSR